jgi:hypothetical protein
MGAKQFSTRPELEYLREPKKMFFSKSGVMKVTSRAIPFSDPNQRDLAVLVLVWR